MSARSDVSLPIVGLRRVEIATGPSTDGDPGGHLPNIARVRQTHRQPEVADIRLATARAIRDSRIRDRLAPGGRIAITVGSRGIAEIARIARSAVDTVRSMGFDPFVVAAMGSHG